MKAEEATPTPPRDCPELEDLAAMIDGHVDGEARERLLAHVADCEACYEIFVMTARLREESRESDVPSAGRVRVGRGGRGALFALAASVLLAVALWRPWVSRTPQDPQLSLASLTAATVQRNALADGWAEDPWPSEERGVESTDGRRRDLRLGARTVVLDVALNTGDRTAASGVLTRLLQALENLPRSQAVRAAYRDLEKRLSETDTSELVPVSRHAAERLRRHPGVSDAFVLGQWLSAGQIAAAGGAGEHFAEPSVRAFFVALEAPELSSQDRRGIEDLLNRDPSDEQLAALERRLASVLGR